MRSGRFQQPALALLALAWLFSGRAQAQIEALPPVEVGILAGRVEDEAGHPVVGAVVRLPQLMRSAITGPDGVYRIADLPPGRTRLAVQRFGFEPVVRDVEISGLVALDVRLTTTPFAVNPVLVTSTRSPIAPLASPLPSATLFGEPLRRHQTVSLAHVIETLAGVRTLSTGAQIGKPVIRGSLGPRVLVLDDGRRLEGFAWHDEDAPPVDVRQLQRVEVVRGPASVLYGSDALIGVVNAIPADLPEAAAGLVLRTGVEAYGASNNLERGAGLRFEGGTRTWGWRAHAIGRASENLHTPDGELQNSGFDALNGEAAVGLRGAPGNVTLRYVRYGGEFEILEPSGGSIAGVARRVSDDRVQLGANYFVQGLRLEARGQWQRHHFVETGSEPAADPVDLLLDTDVLDLLVHHEAERLHGSIGVHGLAQENDTRGPIPLVPDAHVVSGAVFVFEQVDAGRWSFLAGAREDLRHLDALGNSVLRIPDTRRDWDRLSADVGVVFRPAGGVAVAANLGRAWRAPTLYELFANGPRTGESRWEVGDPDLDPETSLVLDGGVRWQLHRSRGEVAGFRTGIEDYIQLVPTNEIRAGLPVFRHAPATATLYGGELRGELEIVRGLNLRGSFETVHGDDTDADAPLARIPPARGIVGATYSWKKHAWMESALVGGEVELVDEQRRRSDFDARTASYALLHLEGGLVERWGGREVAIDLAVRNALDTPYRDYLSRYKEFALDPGRNVLLRISTEF